MTNFNFSEKSRERISLYDLERECGEASCGQSAGTNTNLSSFVCFNNTVIDRACDSALIPQAKTVSA